MAYVDEGNQVIRDLGYNITGNTQIVGNNSPFSIGFSFLSGYYLYLNNDANFEAISAYQVVLRQGNNGAPQTINVAVNDVNENLTSFSATAVAFNENAAGVRVADLNLVDPDSAPGGDSSFAQYNYVVTRNGQVDNRFEVRSDGDLYLKAGESLNYEATPSITLSVRATNVDNGSHTAARSVTISPSNLNENPVLSLGAVTSIAENTSVETKVAVLSVADPDNDAVQYDVSDARFYVKASDGDLYLKAGQTVDFETASSIAISVKAIDQGGLNSNTVQVNVQVTNVNEAPTDLTTTAVNAVPENTAIAAGTIVSSFSYKDDGGAVGSLTGADAALFAITNLVTNSGTTTGDVVWAADAKPNFEAKGVYDLNLSLSDGAFPAQVKVLDVTVTDIFEGGGLIDPNAPPPVDPTPDPNAPFDGGIAAVVVSSFVNGKTPANAEKLTSLSDFAELQFAAYTNMGVADPDVGPYEALGRGFSTTTEFKAKYDALGEDAFIKKVYTDVLGRAATTEQVAHFQAQVDYFQSIYGKAGVSTTDGTLFAKGAVMGQILSIAVLDEAADHDYAGAAAAFIADAADGQVQWGLPLSHWDIA